MERVYPPVSKELKEVVIDYNERLKLEAVPKLI
jgi:hypothetical protein